MWKCERKIFAVHAVHKKIGSYQFSILVSQNFIFLMIENQNISNKKPKPTIEHFYWRIATLANPAVRQSVFVCGAFIAFSHLDCWCCYNNTKCYRAGWAPNSTNIRYKIPWWWRRTMNAIVVSSQTVVLLSWWYTTVVPGSHFWSNLKCSENGWCCPWLVVRTGSWGPTGFMFIPAKGWL